MGNRPDDKINRDVIIKIVKERLIQNGDKQEIQNSLVKLGYTKQEAKDIICVAIKDLENIGVYLKSNNFILYILVFIIILLIFIYFILK
ncbi:MAG: hypothetical protein N3E50_02355 [Candidatus Goldbacteria bacterium]|nr:hypothetical protein [Candidatus Goldiibacteriota bacterium]